MSAAAIAMWLMATPAAAQHGHMPGMTMPGDAPAAPAPAAPPPPSPPPTTAPDDADGAPGDGKPPPPPADHAADRFYAPAAMAQARAMLHAEHGGMAFHQILFNLAEVQIRRGREGYRWDAEGWFGTDIDRLVVKSEGEGQIGRPTDQAEGQLLYSRAVGPYFDLQGGIRQDLGAGPKRSYATVGIEGLAPYWFDVEARLFLSTRGDLLGRLEGWHDARVTQRLVLQPRVELNFAAQNVPASRIGRGLSDAELGLRLRYEILREFAPYLGISWQRRIGDSARYARSAGEEVSATGLVIGTRFWF